MRFCLTVILILPAVFSLHWALSSGYALFTSPSSPGFDFWRRHFPFAFLPFSIFRALPGPAFGLVLPRRRRPRRRRTRATSRRGRSSSTRASGATARTRCCGRATAAGRRSGRVPPPRMALRVMSVACGRVNQRTRKRSGQKRMRMRQSEKRTESRAYVGHACTLSCLHVWPLNRSVPRITRLTEASRL